MIRNLNEKDFDEYYRARLNSLEKYPIAYSSMPKFFKECPMEKHLSLLEDSGSNSSFFLKGFFEDDKLIGLVGMAPESRESVDHKASMWGFYVDPKHQGRGVGRKLLEAFLIGANADEKLSSVRLMAAVNCVEAISLFTKVGFEKYGLEKDSIRDEDNNYYDQIYMQKICGII
jgi:ribosomal protein S18 acetylase RimI-like enzyme